MAGKNNNKPEISDEELDKQIDAIDNEEEPEESKEPVEEPEEETEEETEEPVKEPETIEDAVESIEESEESEETAEEESAELQFEDLEKANEAYKNLYDLQAKQATELGNLRKKVLGETQPSEPAQPADKQQTAAQPERIPDPSSEEWAEWIVNDPQKAFDYQDQRQNDKIAERELLKSQRENYTQSLDAVNEFIADPKNKDMTQEQFNSLEEVMENHHKQGTPITKALMEKYWEWSNLESVKARIAAEAKHTVIKQIKKADPKVRTLQTSDKGAKAKRQVDLSKARTKEEVEEISGQMTDEEIENEIAKLDGR